MRLLALSTELTSGSPTNIWVTDFNSTTVTKLLASTGALVGTFTVGTQPNEAAFDGAHVWVTNFGGTTVSKL